MTRTALRLVLLGALAAAGCGGQQPATHAGHQGGPADVVAVARPPFSAKASTPTPTFDAEGRLWVAWVEDGSRIESVLIPEEDHHTLCVSSQVGCRQACAFCRTATLGFSRNLRPAEITGQVLAARSLRTHRIDF